MPAVEGRLSRKDRIWVGVLVTLGVAVTLIAIFPDVLPLNLPRLRLFTRDWTVLREGRCSGIALLELNGDYTNLPKAVGTPRGFSLQGKSPAFFFTIPARYDPARTQVTAGMPPTRNEPLAYLVTPNGDETPLNIQQAFEAPQAAAVLIPRSYPPDLPHLDVKVVLPGGDTTIWRLNQLPKSEEAFSTAKADLREEQRLTATIRVEGLAWSQERASGSVYPMLVMALRADGLKGHRWEWREMRWMTPYSAPGERPSDSGILRSGVDPKQPTFGQAASAEYAHLIPAVRASGQLVRFVELEEGLDFGTIPVRRRSNIPAGAPHGEFLLDPPAPLPRTTSRGLRVTLVPFEGPKNSSFSMGAPVLHLRLQIDPATFPASLPPEWRKEDAQKLVEAAVDVPKGDSVFQEFYSSRHDRRIGQVMPEGGLIQVVPGLKPGPFRLRVRVRRRVAMETYPFDLRLPVVHRLNPPSRHTMSGRGSMSFDPDWPMLRRLTSAARAAPTPPSAGSGATR